ncbi:MAG: serine/threonine-protein kinase, partial [Acidobacteriota bacterium]
MGFGRFAEVFLAHDRWTAARVALKRGRQADSAAAFADEFARVAPLVHPGIARALDLGRDEATSRPFIVFEAIEGTASDLACRQRPPDELLSWAAGVAEILDFVHHSGLIHGDLKPEHVVIEPGGTPKLIDFGLARQPDEPGGGSPATVAPEILTGGDAEPRSDLFSLGATLFFWLYKAFPFGSKVDERLARIDKEVELPDSPRIARETRSLLTEMLAPLPTSRPTSAREVVQRLAERGVPLPDARLADPAARARSVPIVGRDRVLEALQLAWSTAPTPTAFLALVGPAGSGRTRIAQEVVQRARLAGRRAVLVPCAQQEAPGALLLKSLRAMRRDASFTAEGSPQLAVVLQAMAEVGPTTIVLDDADALA